MTKHRNRNKPVGSLQDRLIAFAEQRRDKASALPEGEERTALLKKADQADTTAQMKFVGQ